MIIQLAPTGMIPSRGDTPNVPITPEEIAKDTNEAYRLGASVVHLHARDGEGRPTYLKEVYGNIISLIREKCPNIIICVSTSGRMDMDIGHRSEVLSLRPDMASLMMGHVNFSINPSINTMDTIRRLACAMNDRGIKPELEIFEPGFINTAKYLARKGYLKTPLHFNLLLGSLGDMPADFRDLAYLVESLPPGSTWSAAGIGRFQTQITAAAILMGGHVRTGIEDSIYYNYETRELATNKGLVERAVRMAHELGRDIATPAEAREILGLERKAQK
ncbi:3-keto-5-aminohexanoate cleavage protein [Methanocella sp.]|uniref:3-keto-5-aminohexanoate cleavage protein n=1 Tax=Methanocella sp. TaxID=2052833 RepID=UPI002D7E5DDC|nr:3-keto-5-aminohexanoate cleavage protein [Methanocella sp.]